MNTNKLHTILNTLSVSGIETAIVDVEEGSNNLLIRGVDKDKVTFVFHEMNGNDVTEIPIGIESIQPLVNKMSLMDMDNTVAEYDERDNCMSRITFKEGRKKVTHALKNTSKLSVPKNINFDEIKSSIVLTKEQIDEISKVLSTFNPEKVMLTGIGNDIVMKVEDKDSNTFENVIGSNNVGDWKYVWQKDKFIKLIKTSMSENETDGANLAISSKGIIYFDINDIIIMLFPSPE